MFFLYIYTIFPIDVLLSNLDFEVGNLYRFFPENWIWILGKTDFWFLVLQSETPWRQFLGICVIFYTPEIGFRKLVSQKTLWLHWALIVSQEVHEEKMEARVNFTSNAASVLAVGVKSSLPCKHCAQQFANRKLLTAHMKVILSVSTFLSISLLTLSICLLTQSLFSPLSLSSPFWLTNHSLSLSPPVFLSVYFYVTFFLHWTLYSRLPQSLSLTLSFCLLNHLFFPLSLCLYLSPSMTDKTHSFSLSASLSVPLFICYLFSHIELCIPGNLNLSIWLSFCLLTHLFFPLSLSSPLFLSDWQNQLFLSLRLTFCPSISMLPFFSHRTLYCRLSTVHW